MPMAQARIRRPTPQRIRRKGMKMEAEQDNGPRPDTSHQLVAGWQVHPLQLKARPRAGAGLWVLLFEGERKPFPFMKTAFNEDDGRFSPNGHWVAFESDESRSQGN